MLIADTLLSFVKRALNIRIGLVPLSKTQEGLQQATILYHLLDTYGLQAAMSYLQPPYATGEFSTPSKSRFDKAIEGRKIKTNKASRTLDKLLASEDYQDNIAASKNWARRLAAYSKIPPMFVNGVALPRDESWLQTMSTRVSTDLQALQQAIYQEKFTQDSWLPSFFLAKASARRNSLVVPEDDKNLKVFDVNKILGDEDILGSMPRLEADPSSAKSDWAHVILISDLESEAGAKLLATAASFKEANPSIELLIVHNAASDGVISGLSGNLFTYVKNNAKKLLPDVKDLKTVLTKEKAAPINKLSTEANEFWHKFDTFAKSLGLRPGESGILINGRLIGPIPNTFNFELEDFEQMLSYERTQRIIPAYTAMEALEISDKIADPLAAAKISSIVAISTISDTPDGIFESATTLRMSQFDVWNTSHTVIEIGDLSTASIQFTVLLDPASELGQKWVPLLKALSQLDGVHTKIFLNPKDRLSELPVKRFYRYVLDPKPTFDDAGALKSLSATFTGVPQEALLTVGMDIPPAWLVAPRVSIHDLDNIKLSSIKTDIDALYELENILIEGHSREIPGGAAPRGAQLVLGTARDHHAADTIIMANLGYFQFKANPGFYNIHLQKGRSSDIFNIDSIGSQGWSPVPGDESTEMVLMSFKGATLYPRLSRKPGMEDEDVLEAKTDSPLDFVNRGFNFAQGILGKHKSAQEKNEQAEINIFSVASGHLYERMLNIMMVTVMKNTQHSVKFWFIEQFLSPSFKDFIPYMAAEYGFQYEMVTYKWPHWLRAQTEKQREIWGYKILFLDVLFPLSLDKVIFVDADQIVRTDMIDLVNHDLKGAPYGFTPMCDSRTEMEGFRFWKQGYWHKFLRGLPYHISALYVVDLHRFRQIAAGDRLRQQYHQLSADPNSLSNLDQDLPNHMQSIIPIHSLPQEWLWCETWCSDESLAAAKTIDLCNNPLTKEPKLDRARRQVPEWTMFDEEIARLDRRRRGMGLEEFKAEKAKKMGKGGEGKWMDGGAVMDIVTEKNEKSRAFEEEVEAEVETKTELKTKTGNKKDEL